MKTITLLRQLIRSLRCIFGHSPVTILRQEGYYQYGVCNRCSKEVERDGHIWSSDKWNTSLNPKKARK